MPCISELVASGRLITISSTQVPAQRSYRVINLAPGNAMAETFTQWLKQQAEQTRLALP